MTYHDVKASSQPRSAPREETKHGLVKYRSHWELFCWYSNIIFIDSSILHVNHIVFHWINASAWINAPSNFLLSLAISQELSNRSKSYFRHLLLRYSGVNTASFMEIRQGFGFVFCLRARRVYLAKYGISPYIRHYWKDEVKHMESVDLPNYQHTSRQVSILTAQICVWCLILGPM